MQGVFLTPLGPILVLWIGALVFYVLDRFLEPQDAGVAEVIVLILGIGSLLFVRTPIGKAIDFGRFLADMEWQSVPLFLVPGRISWTLALILLATALAAALASLGRVVRGRDGRLAALGATLITFFAGHWAILALAWVLADMFLLFTLEELTMGVSWTDGPHGTWGAKGSGERTTQHLGRIAFLSLGGAVTLGVTLLLWQQAGGGTWVDRSVALVAAPQAPSPSPAGQASTLPGHVAGLGMLAALLRLMPFPLPSWQMPADADRMPNNGSQPARSVSPLARVVLYAVPTLSSVYLWARLTQWGMMAQGRRWLVALSLWAGLALLVSALKAWGAREPGQLIVCVPMYGVTFTFLGAALDLPATWQWHIGASAVLSVCALLVSWTQCQYLQVTNLRSYWRIVPAGLALLSLAGIPLTIGFPARVAVYYALFARERWLLLLLIMAAEAAFMGALLRIILDIESVEDDSAAGPALRPTLRWGGGGWPRDIGYVAGALLALGVIILGFAPATLSALGLGSWFGLPRVPIWAALLLPIVGALALHRSQEAISAWASEWWPLIGRALDLEWAYQAVEGIARLVGSLIWGASRVVEGAGYMAWVVLFCLVVLLLVLVR